MTPQVEIDRNYVVIEGVKIERQVSCSPMQWLEYWESDPDEMKALQDKIDDLEEEVDELKMILKIWKKN